ncbi:ABC transporter permease [Mycobacterium sp. C31M]
MIDDPGPGSASPAAVQELRALADVLRMAESAAAAAEWGDDTALAAAARTARVEVARSQDSIGADIGASGASPQWLARAADHARGVAATSGEQPAAADVVVAVGLARAAVAEAVLTVARAREIVPEPTRAAVLRRARPALPGLARRAAAELRHIVFDSPRAILARTAITLGIALSIVAFYHFAGLVRYDAGRLTLYLFSAVIGSVICTNALCFEAERVRRALSAGERIWQVLVTKNLAMATLVIGAGLPVILALTATGDGNPVAMIDQLVTMVFIWLGVGNVLSVVYPLRHEPFSARIADGTWKPFLFSFALSYGVGLTVNLMIYWRLWSRQTASRELVGGDWAAFALVLASALTSWVLLTVFAVACSREPRVRALLSREMVPFRKPAG